MMIMEYNIPTEKSPYTKYDNGACHVRSDGIVGYSNYNHTNISYGRRSPDTSDSHSAWQVFPSGVVDGYNGTYVGHDSYGKYSIRLYIIRIDKYNLVFI